MKDMREWLRERNELAQAYADDGAYYSAARVTAETAERLKEHAESNGSLSMLNVKKGIDG